MSFKKLLLLCSLSAALLTPVAVASARQKAGPAQASQRVKRAVNSMARAIEVYTSSGSLKGAKRHVHVVEEEVTALTYILPAESLLLNALEVARNSLTHAALISDAYRARRRIPDEELEALSVICAEYGVPPGRGVRLQTGECLRLIMRELRKRQREAVSVASREGVYTPR
ncbi:MAG: hypothetical protein ABW208_11290 [Pyrinomonadaceae bacterium]